uniref:Proteasome 26S subunit, ATPase 3 n=1 Tax=Pipistrellus kuhlii TaxID=59472 RepID=A0A7J7X1U0_PIPKU|nr:proteasome 26S subunit, ATPase 3 [Pipistrellus kuhlii]
MTSTGPNARPCVWRRGATELTHEDYMEGILEVQAKKKANLQYYA